MKRTAAMLIGLLLLAFASRADAQQFEKTMAKLLELEEGGKYREAVAGWQSFLKTPGLVNNLDKKESQEIYFTAYFHCLRALHKTALRDPNTRIKDRTKLIHVAAHMILALEKAKSKAGWEIVEPLIQEYFKEPETDAFKKEYEKLKGLPAKESWLPWMQREVAVHRDVIIESGKRDERRG